MNTGRLARNSRVWEGIINDIYNLIYTLKMAYLAKKKKAFHSSPFLTVGVQRWSMVENWVFQGFLGGKETMATGALACEKET